MTGLKRRKAGYAVRAWLFSAFVLVVPAGALPSPARGLPLPARDESPLGRVLTSLYNHGEPGVVQVIARRPVGPCARSADGWERSETVRPVRVTLRSTGVVMDREGRILACADGAQPADSITVVSSDGRRRVARFLTQDVPSGLALLAVHDPVGLVPGFGAELVEPLHEGDWVVVHGFQGAAGALELRLGRMQRVLTAAGPSQRAFRVAMAGSGGACGSAVFDGFGRLRGMVVNVGVKEDADAFVGGYPAALSYLLESDQVSALSRPGLLGLYESMRQNADHPVGFLGVQVALVDSAATPDSEGRALSSGPVTISRIMRGSPAEIAGLRAGDQIVSFDGVPVGRVEHVTERIAPLTPGAIVRVGVLRQGAPLVLTAEVGDRTSMQWLERQMRLNQGLHVQLRDRMARQERYLRLLERLEDRYR